MPSLRTVVKVRKDESKVKTLSCFKWKDLLHSLKYSDVLGDFSAYTCYVPLEFYFVVYGNTKHFQISSNGNSSFFAVEMWYYTCDFPITIAWYLEAFLFIPFCSYHLLTFARSAFITSSTFSAVLPAKKNRYIVSIRG